MALTGDLIAAESNQHLQKKGKKVPWVENHSWRASRHYQCCCSHFFQPSSHSSFHSEILWEVNGFCGVSEWVNCMYLAVMIGRTGCRASRITIDNV